MAAKRKTTKRKTVRKITRRSDQRSPNLVKMRRGRLAEQFMTALVLGRTVTNTPHRPGELAHQAFVLAEEFQIQEESLDDE